jgi:hypothetical protein
MYATAKRERDNPMMTIAFSIRILLKQVLQWTALAGAFLIMGQATVLAGETVSVLMKQRLADMTGKEATVLTVDLCAGSRIRSACPSGLGVRLRSGRSGCHSVRG